MKNRRQAGFTLLEMVMVIIIIGILGAVAVRSADFALDRTRYESTLAEMEHLGHAISGNADLVSAGRRTDFGYVGDMGSLPNTLDDLVTDPGGTWAGPYLVNPLKEDPDAFKTDSWGQPYTYPAEGSRVKIASSGGGSAVTYQFAPSEASLTTNTIVGSITDWNGANPVVLDLPNITVTVYYPSGGALTSASMSPTAGGLFSISGIPVGIRRVVATHSVLQDSCVKLVTVTPGSQVSVDLRFNGTLPGTGGASGGSSLFYVPGSARTLGFGNCHVEFWIQNYSTDPVGISSLTAVYTHSPTAWYFEVRLDGTPVWSGSTGRGSGDVTTFAERSVAGGATAVVQLRSFQNNPFGGMLVDMSGTDFTVTLSDGSVVAFTTP